MWSVAMTCTKTNFKIGDILRLTVETWNRKTSGTTGTMTYAIGHDPMNRDGAYVIPTTQDNITASHALIPFAIEV